MRRIVRDTWAWRGALAPDELRYTPVLGDAMSGPITAPARTDWPVLTSQLEAAWSVPGAEGHGVHALTGPAAAHLALVARTGGYHAVIPRNAPEIRAPFEAIRGHDDGVPTLDEALTLLESGGVIERTATRLALMRPAPPSVDRMRQMRDRLDDHDHRAPDDPVTNRLLRAVWRQTYSGIGTGRFRELARHGRLRATIDLTPRAAPVDGFFEVGVGSLPELHGDLVVDRDQPYPERSWIPLNRIVLRAAEHGPVPLLATRIEVGALLLGRGEGANAVRRAVRGTVVWQALARRTGWTTGPVHVSTATLAEELASMLGLKAGADHRKLVRSLLADLERAGLLDRDPATDGPVLLRPPAPDAALARHAFDAYTLWRPSISTDPPAPFSELLRAHRDEGVRAPWARALEERRVRVEVLPGD
jgi:hypothetical protein